MLLAISFVLIFGSTLHAQDSFETSGPQPITIKAYVDGPSELHVTPDGVYWINGKNAKPGKLDGANFPTYVNGEAWFPLWQNRTHDRGEDKSFPHSLQSPSIDFDFKLISVGYTKDDNEMVKRTPVTYQKEGPEYVVYIPDPEPGAMWYTFVLTPKNSFGQ
jgi:hypothetical protein